MIRLGDDPQVPGTFWIGVLAVVAFGVVTLDGPGGAVAAPLLVAGLTDDSFWGLVGWIAGVAALGGLIGWGISTVAFPEAVTIALVFGIAIGGGFGAFVRVFVLGDDESQETESVTVGSASTEDDSPSPQPADLFEEHPDPVVYFDAAGDGPVVRAVNRAFEDTFGVSGDAVTNAALADASMATDRVDDLVAAAANGDAFDVVVPCETDVETRRFRIRTAAVTDGAGARGYVVYTPTES